MVETDFITKIIREATAKYRKGAEEHGGYDFSWKTYDEIEMELLDQINYNLMQIERNRRLKANQLRLEQNVTKPVQCQPI
jgi:GH18 family chitinase